MKKLFLLSFLSFLLMGRSSGQTVIINTDISSNRFLSNDTIYELQGGFIYVTGNSTLTIEKGTLIKGNASSLVITRGSKIVAQGTPAEPIVMTSWKAAGTRAAADWGGLLLLGKAPINDPAGERLAEGGIDPTKGLYGGTIADDSSGAISYLRIEYAGIAFQPNNETNGLTCGAVGSKTMIDHVQVSFGGDDAFEWFGGTVNCKYLVALRALDDDFDTDYGFGGRIQFAVSLRDSNIADVSGSNGFESDNDAGGTTNAPLTKAIFTNVTIFGPRKTLTTSINPNYKRSLHLRRSTSTCAYNCVFVGHPIGLKIENQNTWNNAVTNTLQFKNNIIAGATTLLDSTGLTITGPNYMNSWFNANGNSSLTNPTDVQYANPYNYTSPDFNPMGGSPVLSGAGWTSPNLNNPFFTQTTYRGAFDGITDWTDCWTNFDPQNTPYTTPGINNLPLTVSAGGATTFCQGGSVTLTANTTATGFSWSNGGNTQSINVTTSGTYTVTVTDVSGCTNYSDPIIVNVLPLPTATATPNGATTFCDGSSVVITANTATSYAWSNGAITQSITATTSGSYVVTITDANSCSNSSSPVVVTVNALPTATATPNGSTTFCTGDSVEICANAASSYLWSTNATTQCIWVFATGSYTVQVTDGNGCESVASNTVNTSVSSTPLPTVNANGPTTFCTGESVDLCASVSDSYLWSTGDTTQCITVIASGVFTVAVTNANICDGIGTSTPTTVTVSTAPGAGFTSSGNFPTMTFSNTSTGETIWFWDFGDQNSSSVENPTHTYATEGDYTVCLTVTNGSGCTDSVCHTVSVLTGVDETSFTNTLNFFPNPFSDLGTLEFNLENGGEISLVMINLEGKIVWQSNGNYPSGTSRVDVSGEQFPSGMYFIRLRAGENTETIKVVLAK